MQPCVFVKYEIIYFKFIANFKKDLNLDFISVFGTFLLIRYEKTFKENKYEIFKNKFLDKI